MAREVVRARHLFHWELEFPEVFFGSDGRRLENGGFDAVMGNPPWDMIRAEACYADAREDPGGRVVLRFTRDAGIYTAQSDGHANHYQLFIERAVSLTRRGGRVGLVLPAGLATDTAARRCAAGCSARATWMRWSGSKTSEASSPFTAASGFCS